MGTDSAVPLLPVSRARALTETGKAWLHNFLRDIAERGDAEMGKTPRTALSAAATSRLNHLSLAMTLMFVFRV
jgi:hypothetical protein